jgi:hypothetical protein
MPQPPATLPAVRTISPWRPLVWLVYGWRDMTQVGWVSFAHGLALALVGAAIAAIWRKGGSGCWLERCRAFW